MNVFSIPGLMMVFGFWVPMLGGCSTSAPKLNSDSSAVQSLNGANYQLPFGADGNLLKQGGSHTVISGELVILNGLPIPEPLKYQKLILMDGQKEIATAMSNSGGRFTFTGDISNGVYRIILVSPNYAAEQQLNVNQYKIENIQVFAREK
jgi:hypothetical protein